MGDARRYFSLPSPFPMKRGGELHGAHVAYETWGTLNPARDNAVLVLTGLSPSAHMMSCEEDPTPGWWEEMAGPGKAIDSDRWFVICVNSLGSDKGSTCPASIDPATGQPYRLTFPQLALEDVGNAAHAVVASLGIERLACLIGCSMGGMSALAYMLLHPGSVRTHISVDTAPQAQPFAIAIRSLQREAIRLDPEQREDEPFGREFQVESYLEGHAQRFVRNFDPNSYLYLSRASDWFDIAEYGHGSVLEGLKRIHVEQAMVIGVSTDILFPLQQQEQIAEGLQAAGAQVEFVALDSPQGHDAFLVDIDNYSRAIGGFLGRLALP